MLPHRSRSHRLFHTLAGCAAAGVLALAPAYRAAPASASADGLPTVAPFAPRAPLTPPPVRLTVLGDNSVTLLGVKAFWGFSCLVEAHGHTVLFDAGGDPGVLRDNLAFLKIDPAKIEAAVFSHVHTDHTLGAPGLGTLAGVAAYTPQPFDRQPPSASALAQAGLKIVPIAASTPLFPGFTLSQPLPFLPAAGAKNPPKPGAPVNRELCLAIDTPQGLVVIVGCAHPGILPMVEQVQRDTGRPIHYLIGGFHLLHTPAGEVRQIAERLLALGIAKISATHCTGEDASFIFRQVFGDRYVRAGVGAVIGMP